MPTVEVDGHELFYELRGAGEPLLAIMGMSGTHRTWGDPFLEALERDFQVLVYDHRGVGRSSRVADAFTIERLARDADAVLDAVGWASAHVLGISMGGMVAQELALARPRRVRTLTLGCTYAGGPGAALAPETTVQRLGAGWSSGDREAAVRTAWEVNVSAAFAADGDAWERFRRTALELPVALPVIMLQLQAIGSHDTSARLRELAMPVLVVHGSEDAMLPVGNAEAIAQRIPAARLEIWDGVGHLFFWERPDDAAALVRDHALGQ
jgi:pimeloyl-ACP methyl ester carboxylesterase